MHYVRFLKQPTLRLPPKTSKARRGVTSGAAAAGAFVHALLTIETDLGDSIYYGTVELTCTLIRATSSLGPVGSAAPNARGRVDVVQGSQVVDSVEVTWTSGLRSLAIEVPLSDNHAKDSAKVMRLCVAAKGAIAGATAGELESYDDHFIMPVIIPQTSAVITESNEMATGRRQVERPLAIGQGKELVIWEDAGVSMARHVWDAGVALVMLFGCIVHHHYCGLVKTAELLLMVAGGHRIRVLELGGGCGAAGIAFAALVSNAQVIISDVAEAERLVRRNIAANKSAKGSSVDFQTLDWAEELPDGISELQFDIALVADCIYNEDSIPSLVKTLSALCRISGKMIVLVATKTRHSSERSFFDLATKAGFSIGASTWVFAPAGETAEDLNDAERIDMYEFAIAPS